MYLIVVDIGLGGAWIALKVLELSDRPLPTETPFLGRLAPPVHFVARLAPGLLPIVLGVTFYQRKKGLRGVGLACGWIALFFGVFITVALIALWAHGADLNKVEDFTSAQSMALWNSNVSEFWWAIGWAGFAFFTGGIHLWVLTRAEVRDFFRVY
jgi:hypothetical protein